MLLIEQPEVWAAAEVRPGPVPAEPFVEEVLRLESPVQGLLREAAVDVELHGVDDPGRLGREPPLRRRRTATSGSSSARPSIDLEREQAAHRHLAFGVGTHHCLGAPLARRELLYGFKALVDRIDELWFIEGANDFAYHQNFFLRALKELHIGFRPAGA